MHQCVLILATCGMCPYSHNRPELVPTAVYCFPEHATTGAHCRLFVPQNDRTCTHSYILFLICPRTMHASPTHYCRACENTGTHPCLLVPKTCQNRCPLLSIVSNNRPENVRTPILSFPRHPRTIYAPPSHYLITCQNIYRDVLLLPLPYQHMYYHYHFSPLQERVCNIYCHYVYSPTTCAIFTATFCKHQQRSLYFLQHTKTAVLTTPDVEGISFVSCTRSVPSVTQATNVDISRKSHSRILYHIQTRRCSEVSGRHRIVVRSSCTPLEASTLMFHPMTAGRSQFDSM